MKRTFTVSLWQEGEWVVAQCLEVDVASQGRTEEEALKNLREALELFFEEPQPPRTPKIRRITLRLGASEASAFSGSEA